MPDYLLGIDQGTSGSRALILDREGQVRGYGYRKLERFYPRPDWVEQDPNALAAGVREAIAEALQHAQCHPSDIAACGLTSQRDTDFVWDTATGKSLANAITWQDLRTQPLEDELHHWPHAAEARTRLGYWPGPYSAALHLKWRMENDAAISSAARAGTLRIGLSALWVLNALGHANGHQADVSLAQSMCLYDFRARDYWPEWLDYLGVPRAALPDVNGTVADFGALHLDSTYVPVCAMIADQQGALFGYDCRQTGDAECTHGTASYVNVCLGDSAPALDTIKVYLAWLLNGHPTYCLEADTTVTGAAVRWLKESARLFDRDEELGELAGSVRDAGGLVFVPAFTGLNVPYNFREARGSLFGLTLGHTRAHIARAFLDSIGFQLRAILEEMHNKVGVRVTQLKVGGGLSGSDVACELQADWLGIPVIRPTFAQTTARAAALLAGLGAGFWKSEADLPPLPGERTVFTPRLSADQRDAGYATWQRAISTVKSWAEA
ncbi:MAG: FGGY family carbohydrate kinase [Anaerolineales bacterium]